MKLTKEIIYRYLKGECTVAEASAIERILENHPHALDEFLPEEEWLHSPIDKAYASQDKVYERLKRQLYPRNRSRRQYIQIAASIAAVFLLIFSVYQFSKNPPIHQSATQLAAATSDSLNSSGSRLYYINSGNENMYLKASDGSLITLYPNSEIRYAEDFGKHPERILQLKGKAKFTVAKDKSKPFRVLSQGIQTTALGTVFIVDEFKAAETRIQLLEGTIAVSSKRKIDAASIVKTFSSMEEITINHQSGQVIQEKKINVNQHDREAYFVQHLNSLHFKNLALKDVVNILEQNYGIDLQYPSQQLENKYYSGIFATSAQVYQAIIKEINYLHKTNITYIKN